MKKSINNYASALDMEAQRVSILWKSAAVGIAVGAVVVLYRFVLTEMEALSLRCYAFFLAHPALLPVLFVGLGGVGYLVGVLVDRHRQISGSGIPQIKGVMLGHFRFPWFSTLWSKFIGGALAILAGLSLGREGPSIQLGASIAEGIGKRVCATRAERKHLIAGGASAGLAAAFNAPLAGVIFAVEEIFKYLSPIVLLSTTIASVVADFLSRLVFGSAPIFSFSTQGPLPMSAYWMVCVLGVILGGAGALYNATLLRTQQLYKKIENLRFRVAIPFLLAGVVGLLFPVALGGGHGVLEHLQFSTGFLLLLLILAVKFAFSMLSFGSGAPGGIFFPLLILGALIGALFGKAAVVWFGLDATLYNNLIILAMAGYFAAIVRAPLTGVVLLLEMTGSFENLLPLVLIAVIASATADMLKSAPIYDALLENMLKDQKGAAFPDEGEKITMETVVHFGAYAAGKRVRELPLPQNCLLIAVRREGRDSIPKGDTLVRANDTLIFLISAHKEARQREAILELTESAR
ncbi:MAG: ClC family H(+)/Cl(-) exchange transporter [Clostridiaceae bacterium]|nr:ClC family H(+)/Cl(-) exchange transporter [Eubacteriales bacterium]